MLQRLETGETANSTMEQWCLVLFRCSGSVSDGFSPLLVQFANVYGGGQSHSETALEPESGIKAGLAGGGCAGFRRGTN